MSGFSPASSHPAASGSSAVQTATVTLTNAQVKALPTTPVEVVAAPGAGSMIVPIHAALRLTWVANYTGIDANALLVLDVSSGSTVLGPLDETIFGGVSGVLASGANAIGWLPEVGEVPASAGTVPLNASSGYADSDFVNAAVRLNASNALAFTGGNVGNSLKVTLLYYVVTV